MTHKMNDSEVYAVCNMFGRHRLIEALEIFLEETEKVLDKQTELC